MKFGSRSDATPPQGLFLQKERTRLILMGVAAFVILVALFFVKDGTQKAPMADAGVPEAPPEEVVIAPRIDRARLLALTRDATLQDRVILEGEALEAAFEESSALRDAVFEPLGGRELDAAALASLAADPQGQRGALYRAWGRVLDVQQLAASSLGNPRNLLRIETEGGATAFLASMLMPQGPPLSGDFLRFDGLFLKLYRADTGQGWAEGPLLVGPRTWRSYPRIEPVTSLSPELFAEVRDDSVVEGKTGMPVVPYWSLVSYVQNLAPDAVDWDAVPLLDNTLINTIFRDGTQWRGVPVRIPECMVLGLWNEAQPENPLRLERMTLGWLGHQPWVGQAKLVHFVSPFVNTEIRERVDQVTARAFFFKNLAYEPSHGGAAITPYFVVHSMQKVVPVESKGLEQLLWVVAGLMLVTVVTIVALLRRDQARSRALQEDLLRRRRLRRARAST
jgi:hypothetical protein